MEGLATAKSCFARSHWVPPPRLNLSEWAQEHYRLPSVSADPGKFRPYRYQIGIMNALTDPNIQEVTFKKSARVGATMILNAWIGYHMHYEPCPMTVAQPTVGAAEKYSKEEIGPMIEDSKVLSALFDTSRAGRKSETSILHKKFPGGVLQLIGANSGDGFRRTTRRAVAGDEVDAWPVVAGDDGDQIKLLKKRTETYKHNKKAYWMSTPLVKGKSRIDTLHADSDDRRFPVPCPHCGYRDELVFREAESGGHYMAWPKGEPEKAHFVCFSCSKEIHESHKYEMLEDEGNEWVATRPTNGHAGFSIWTAYSYSVSWADIAIEFLDAVSKGAEVLRTFVNTWLGQTWEEKGEVPEWEALYARRELYGIGTVPSGVQFLTCGVDVQRNRLVYEIVGWGSRKENWSIECGVIFGDTSHEQGEPYKELDRMLLHSFPCEDGSAIPIRMLAIDSGDQTNVVYSWARRHPMTRVIAVKGVPTAKAIINSPSKVDVTIRGKATGYKLWPVNQNLVKSELYGWLSRQREENAQFYPAGYCHFPEYGEQYFQELTAEHLVTKTNNRGFIELVWEIQQGRENHFLDCRVYARAAAALLGLDRMRHPEPVQELEPPTEGKSAPAPSLAPRPTPPPQRKQLTKPSSWVRGGGARKRKGWL